MRLPQFVRDARSALFEVLAVRRWSRLQLGRPGKPHGLPGELIVSLTSYPPRFSTLALTLACLCDQSVRADRIILWIAEQDIEDLPHEIRWNFRQGGVEIRTCEDLGPYKKLIPALEEFPDAYIVTADDDLHYSRNWLGSLLNGFDGRSVTCLMGFAIVNGRPQWQRRARNREKDVMQCGCGGVLYPPHSMREEVKDRRRFLSVCPTGDDLWFYEMALDPVRKVGRKFTVINWLGTQQCALANENLAGENDRMFTQLGALRAELSNDLLRKPAIRGQDRYGRI